MFAVFREGSGRSGKRKDQNDMLAKGTAVDDSGVVPFVEQAAVFFSSAHFGMVEHTLRSEIDHPVSGIDPHVAWWLLFDLYQVTGQHHKFDQLAITYASRMDVSPPMWREERQIVQEDESMVSRITFAGVLGEETSTSVARARKILVVRARMQLHLGKVTGVQEEGAQQLYTLLQDMRALQCDIMLEQPEPIEQILREAMAAPGTDNPHCWLLCLALQRIQQQKTAFEETSVAYAARFGISPPEYQEEEYVSRVADPGVKEEERAQEKTESVFMMPASLTGNVSEVFEAIRLHAKQYHPLVLDCRHLMLADFTAVTKLGNVLRDVSPDPAQVMLREVSFLVAALFGVVGLHKQSTITHPRS